MYEPTASHGPRRPLRSLATAAVLLPLFLASSAEAQCDDVEAEAVRVDSAEPAEVRELELPPEPSEVAMDEDESPHGHPNQTLLGRWLPLWGRKISAIGHSLPPPVGISYVGFTMERSFEVTRLNLTLPDGSSADIEQVTVLPDSNASANSLRMDVWVLPFLNVYGFYGRTKSDTDTTVTIADPRPGMREPISFSIPTSLSGNTWGGGGVIGGGYKGWFGTANLNYSVTDLEGLDSDITANVNSLRFGRHVSWSDVSGALWLGGTYWNVEKSVSGTVDVPSLGELGFSVDYGPIDPFNMVVGGRMLLWDHLELVFDYGFWSDVSVITGQVGARF